MSATLIVLPLLIPLFSAIVGLLLRGERTSRVVGVTGGALLLAASLALLAYTWSNGVHAVTAGNWPAPMGITLVADMLGAIMVVLAGLIGFAALVYSVGSKERAERQAGYYPLMHILLLGVCGAFLTGDLFNLYVWFEVMLIASFVLLVLGGGRMQMEGALKYVLLNLIASTLFLTGIGLTYALTGTLNLAHLSQRLAGIESDPLITAISMLFLMAFAIKAAMFPLFFWLPASYHTAPDAVAALFAGLLTKVGVYALIRMFTLVFTGDVGYTHEVLLWGAGATMIVGVLGAVAHNDVKRILSFHIVSQIGYMVLGLAVFTPLALAASVFYIAHHVIVKANLFLLAGVIRRAGGGSYHLSRVGGLLRSTPLVAVLFFVPAFSLGGIPPLSGFFAKFAIVRASFEAEDYLMGAVALVVGFFTLYSMAKIWTEGFLKPAPEDAEEPRPVGFSLLGPIALLSTLTLIIGIGAEPFFDASMEASEQLLNRDEYIQAVLGEAE